MLHHRRIIVSRGCFRDCATFAIGSGEAPMGEICGEVSNVRQPNRLNINSPEIHLVRDPLFSKEIRLHPSCDPLDISESPFFSCFTCVPFAFLSSTVIHTIEEWSPTISWTSRTVTHGTRTDPQPTWRDRTARTDHEAAHSQHSQILIPRSTSSGAVCQPPSDDHWRTIPGVRNELKHIQ